MIYGFYVFINLYIYFEGEKVFRFVAFRVWFFVHNIQSLAIEVIGACGIMQRPIHDYLWFCIENCMFFFLLYSSVVLLFIHVAFLVFMIIHFGSFLVSFFDWLFFETHLTIGIFVLSQYLNKNYWASLWKLVLF